ncbi:MAG: glycosyltransferase, partial [Nitrosopumilus sp. D6]
KVREYLAGIDAYALISGIDMSPSSLLEAQLMQRVVLATNVGGIPECMEDGRTGFLISAGDSDGWIKKIKCVLDNPDMMKKMGENGRKFVEDNFGLDKRAKELSDILKNIARQSS